MNKKQKLRLERIIKGHPDYVQEASTCLPVLTFLYPCFTRVFFRNKVVITCHRLLLE